MKDNQNNVQIRWSAIAFVGIWSIAMMICMDSCSTFASHAKVRCDEAYITVEREGFVTEYMTEAEFYLIASFIEAISGDYDIDAKYDLANLIVNRYFSDDYPDKWDELIWKKGDDGLWKYLPEDISLEDVDISEETIYALFLSTLYRSFDDDGTDMLEWEERHGK